MKDITNKRCAFGVDDSTWEKVEVVFFAIHYHRVACVVSTLLVKHQINFNSTSGLSPLTTDDVDETS